MREDVKAAASLLQMEPSKLVGALESVGLSGSRCGDCRAMPGEGHDVGCPGLQRTADARALWAVRVLDRHGRNIGASPPQVHPRNMPDGTPGFHLVCPVRVIDGTLFEWLTFYGATEEAARIAAAEALVAEDPTLGESL